MPQEIERKFLVKDDGWRAAAQHGQYMCQGYIPGLERASVRVRVCGDRAHLNIKSATLGISRAEYEYEIPVHEAQEILHTLCEQPLIEKTRYHVACGGHVWDVDVFSGDNEGLVVAEIELQSTDEPFERPSWLGPEVSHDKRYYNVCLVRHPYKLWKTECGHERS